MKKILTVAVLSTLSFSALANNVQVYGAVDGSLEAARVSDSASGGDDISTHSRVVSNSSYIGFKGDEALGNGLRAVWQLESNVDFNGGSYTNSGVNQKSRALYSTLRDSYVGLDQSKYGSLLLGTISGPYRLLGTMVDHNIAAEGSGFMGSIYGQLGGYKTGTDDRTSNSVSISTKKWMGLSGSVLYSANGGEKPDNSSTGNAKNINNNAVTLGLNYTGYGITAGYAYLNAQNPQNNAVVDKGFVVGNFNDELNAHRLAAKYEFGQGTVISGLYDYQKLDYETTNSNYLRRNAWALGVSHKMGANRVWTEYARAGDLHNSSGAVADSNAYQWTLGYSYSFSQRTLVKAYYTDLSNDSGSRYGFYNNPANTPAAGNSSGTFGSDYRVIGVGLRHNF